MNCCPQIHAQYPQIEFEYVVYDAIPGYIESSKLRGSRFHMVPNRVNHPLKHRSVLRKLIRSGGFDCIWCHMCTLSNVTLLEEAAGAVPLRVVHAHSSQNMGGRAAGLLHGFHKAQIDRIATDFLACSSEAAAFMFPGGEDAPSRVKLVPNGIDVSRFSFDAVVRDHMREERGWGETPILLYVGRMSPEKNPVFALELARSLHQGGVDVRLVMLGDGSLMSEVEERMHRFGMEKYVDLMGSVPNVEAFLSAADALLMPSLFEGLPFSGVEAQASGLPVLFSEGVSEEALLTEGAMRLPLEDTAQWVEASLRALSAEVDRSAGAEAVRAAGFDIRESACDLGAWLLQRAAEEGSSRRS